MVEIQKCMSDKDKQSELWKTMYNRVVNYLPEHELQIVKSSAELEKINMLDENEIMEEQNNAENVVKHKDTLKSTITKLNDDNFNLKIQLERLKFANKNELETLKKFETERDKLINDIHLMREMHSNELKLKAKTHYEMQLEIENYKTRIKYEETKKEELKKRYLTELNSTKIRYENELDRQNKLMRKKYDELVNEIKRLVDIIRKLQLEKKELMNKIEYEKEINKQINERKGILLQNKADGR